MGFPCQQCFFFFFWVSRFAQQNMQIWALELLNAGVRK